MYEIILGIPTLLTPMGIDLNENGCIENLTLEDYEDLGCDFELIKNDDGYHFGFETFLGFTTEDGCKNWIYHCMDMLKKYMEKYNLNTEKELDMYQAFTEGVNVNWCFDSIEDAYAFLKFAVHGFNGQAAFVAN